MNQFELIETIKGHNEALTGAYKYWTTTSFALVAVAYVAGPQLGPAIVIGLAAVYLFLASGNVAMLRLYTRAIAAAIQDLAQLKDTDAGILDSTAVFADSGGSFSRFAGPMITVVMAASSLGAVAYLFFRAGFFG